MNVEFLHTEWKLAYSMSVTPIIFIQLGLWSVEHCKLPQLSLN